MSWIIDWGGGVHTHTGVILLFATKQTQAWVHPSGPEHRWGETCRIAPSPCCRPASLFPQSFCRDSMKICPLTRLTEFCEHGQLWQPPVRCCLLAATSYMCYSCSLVQDLPERGLGSAGVTEREEERESWWSASSATSDTVCSVIWFNNINTVKHKVPLPDLRSRDTSGSLWRIKTPQPGEKSEIQANLISLLVSVWLCCCCTFTAWCCSASPWLQLMDKIPQNRGKYQLWRS